MPVGWFFEIVILVSCILPSLDSFLIVVFAQGFASMHYLNKLTRFSYYNGIEFETVAHTRYKASLNNVKEDMAIKCRMEIARIVMNNIFHIR